MRQLVFAVVFVVIAAAPGGAVDFLGVELCADPVDTGVILPAESPLSLESVEVGQHGGLVMLLHSKKGAVLEQVDDLMASFTGSRGTGDDRKLEWTSDEITGFAQVIKKDYVALAVIATPDCSVEPEAVQAAAPVESEASPQVEATLDTFDREAVAAAAAAGAAIAAVEPTAVEEPTEGESPAKDVDFVLEGRLKHSAAGDDWVDVMGIVVNNSGASYAVASFDLSLYDGDGELICVDTISVNQLKEGQERAFRGAIRCPDYVADEVASWKLQFAGGH
jgi:hypothetical protein